MTTTPSLLMPAGSPDHCVAVFQPSYARSTLISVRITGVRWDEWSEDHIAAHRVGTAEAEGVLFDRASAQRTGREGTLEVYGRTDTGRRLLSSSSTRGEASALS